jgi:UTP--glucose-1-phosphate uridylyltransferase
MANFIYTRQKGGYGNGLPVLAAEPIIGDEPFAVAWWDEIVSASTPRLAQMLQVHHRYPQAVIISGIRIHRKQDLKRYWIGDITLLQDNIYTINNIIEKPDPDQAPSNMMTWGAYILPPTIFEALRKVGFGKSNEMWLVDGINYLKSQGTPVYAVEIEDATYFDTGNKLEYMKTVTHFALQHPEIWPEYHDFITQLVL